MARLRPWPIPLEVTTIIINYVHHEDLVALSRVCKGVQLVAQPKLYTEVRLTWEKQICRHPSPLYKLLDTVLKRVDLAHLVQNLRLGRAPPDASGNATSFLTDGGLTFSARPHYIVGAPTIDAWAHQAADSRGGLDAALARLISSLPRLQHLELSLRCEERSTAFGDMVKCKTIPKNQPTDRPSKALSPLNFNALKCVSYFTAVNLFPLDPSYRQQQQPRFHDFLWLFYLPSIETIRATAVETSLPLAWPENPPTALSLTTLHLLQSHVDEESLETIFVASPNLKTFEYELVCDDEHCHLRRRAYLDCSKLGHALQRLKTSLKMLTISVEFIVRSAWELGSNGVDGLGIRGNLGRLDDFSKLTRLHAPFGVLVGWSRSSGVRLVDTLPFGLRRLCCTDDMSTWDGWPWRDPAVLGQFRDYLRAETSQELEIIELRATERDCMWHSILHEVGLLCESAGVLLKTTNIETVRE